MSGKTFYVVIERDEVMQRCDDLKEATELAVELAAENGEGYEYVVLKAISLHKAEKPQVTSEELG